MEMMLVDPICDAIIIQAFKDYKKAEQQKNEYEKIEVIRFFLSDWGAAICRGTDSKWIACLIQSVGIKSKGLSCIPCGAKKKDGVTMYDQNAKKDQGKPRLTLVPSQIIYDIAQVREYGNKKYKDSDNWKTVDVERYINALYRHFLKFKDSWQSADDESGIEHYKHMACNMAFICELLGGKK